MLTAREICSTDIIARVLDHLPIETLMTCARTCRRVRDMVYDDGIWVHKLRAMGVWNEQEARRRYDEAMAARRKEFQRRKDAETKAQGMVEGGTQVARPESMTIFDAVQEEKTQRKAKEEEERRRVEVDRRRTMGGPPMAAIGGRPMVSLGELLEDAGGFANMAAPIISTMAAPILPERLRQKPIQKQDVEAMLTVFASVVSARGYARQEYGRIHGALAPLYLNLASARTHTDPILFRKFREPEQQAIMLAQLRIFGRADSSYGWHDRLERLESMTSIFENAALREFEGYVHELLMPIQSSLSLQLLGKGLVWQCSDIAGRI